MYDVTGELIYFNWIEQGEKPTRYFLSLEKRNYVNKTVGKLMRSNGTVITSQEDFLAEIETFYKNLYSCYDKELQDVDIETTIDKNYIRVLDENTSNNLEGYITNEEVLLALKNMKNKKKPRK